MFRRNTFGRMPLFFSSWFFVSFVDNSPATEIFNFLSSPRKFIIFNSLIYNLQLISGGEVQYIIGTMLMSRINADEHGYVLRNDCIQEAHSKSDRGAYPRESALKP